MTSGMPWNRLKPCWILGNNFSDGVTEGQQPKGVRGMIVAIRWDEKGAAHPLCSGLRPNHSNQGHRSGDVDAVTFSTAHNRAANGVQLELPPGSKVFLHGAACARGQAVEDRLDLACVNFCAACFRHGQASATAEINLCFHSASA